MTYDKPAYTATRAPSGCYGTVTTEGRVWKLTVFLLYMRTYFVHYHYLVESTSQIMEIRVWPSEVLEEKWGERAKLISLIGLLRVLYFLIEDTHNSFIRLEYYKIMQHAFFDGYVEH